MLNTPASTPLLGASLVQAVETKRPNQVGRERAWNCRCRLPETHGNIGEAIVDVLLAQCRLNTQPTGFVEQQRSETSHELRERRGIVAAHSLDQFQFTKCRSVLQNIGIAIPRITCPRERVPRLIPATLHHCSPA